LCVDNPQIIPCGHSFCSLCLTKRFDKKINLNATDTCPQCREEANVTKMKRNRDLAEIVERFKVVRDQLCVVLLESNKAKDEQIMSMENTKTSSKSTRNKRAKKIAITFKENEECDPVAVDICQDNNIHKEGTPITNKIPFRSFHNDPIKKIKDALIALCKCSRVKISTTGDKTGLIEYLLLKFNLIYLVDNMLSIIICILIV